MLAPFAKFNYIIREIAKSMELDPEKVTNNMDEAAVQAELLKAFQGNQPQPQQEAPPAGANPLDPTGAGGGNIGTGQAPIPGEQGFTGVPRGGLGQDANVEQTQNVGQQPPTDQQLQ